MSQQPNQAITRIAQQITPLPNNVSILGGTKEGRKSLANQLAEEYKRLAKDRISISLEGEGMENAVIKTFVVAPEITSSKIMVFMTHDEAGQETFVAQIAPQAQSEPSNPIYIHNSIFPRGLVGFAMKLLSFTFISWFLIGSIQIADRYVLLQEAQAGYPAAKAKLEKLQQGPDHLMEEVRKQ